MRMVIKSLKRALGGTVIKFGDTAANLDLVKKRPYVEVKERGTNKAAAIANKAAATVTIEVKINYGRKNTRISSLN